MSAPSDRFLQPSAKVTTAKPATGDSPAAIAALAVPPAGKLEFFGLRFDPEYLCKTPDWADRRQVNASMASGGPLPLGAAPVRPDPLSPGDLLELKVRDGAMFDGALVVSGDGTVRVPELPPLQVAGRSIGSVEQEIERLLVEQGFFRSHAASATLTLRQLGEVSINVSGAVFEPGLVSAGQRTEKNRDDVYDAASGADNWRRKLSGLLKAAGGLRPDADVSRVTLRRSGQVAEFDMSGVLTGAPVDDPLVVAGDSVFVPSRSCFEPSLVRLSRVTPPGIRIFVSNPTAPSLSSGTSVGGPFSSRMPYGTRLLQALVSANCVGGTDLVNADRYALVVGENPLSGEPEGLKVRVQEVMLNPHRADLNPYLQANDAVACYDSTAVNVGSLAQILSSTFSPAQILARTLGL